MPAQVGHLGYLEKWGVHLMPLKILMISYLILVTVDSATTYIGIKHFGLVETWRSQILFEYYGLLPGIIISTALCFCFAWLFFSVRRFKAITYLGLSALTLTELAAMTNNVFQILSS